VFKTTTVTTAQRHLVADMALNVNHFLSQILLNTVVNLLVQRCRISKSLYIQNLSISVNSFTGIEFNLLQPRKTTFDLADRKDYLTSWVSGKRSSACGSSCF